MIQYEPHLLGEYATPPELKSEKDEDVKEFLKKYVCIKKKPMKYQKNCFP